MVYIYIIYIWCILWYINIIPLNINHSKNLPNHPLQWHVPWQLLPLKLAEELQRLDVVPRGPNDGSGRCSENHRKTIGKP